MPLDPRHASRETVVAATLDRSTAMGAFFVRRKRAIVRVNESCGGDVAVVLGGSHGDWSEGWLSPVLSVDV